MVRALVGSVVALAVSASFAGAQQPRIQQGTIARTAPDDAKAMFSSYCAVCHGQDGKGSGPAARALTKAPADLTKISARNNGQFPGVRVRRYIEGSDEIAAHGTRDMPMWGDLFRGIGTRETATLRVEALADYIKGLQQ
jgi:mono/diheme cytochrome c family protein